MTASVRTLGLLADPDAPTELAQRIADDLPGLLAGRVSTGDDDDGGWRVEVETAARPIDRPEDLLDAADERRRGRGWDVAVYLTDAPLWTGGAPVIADVDATRQVAGLSVPALGGPGLLGRTREAVVRLVAETEHATTGPGMDAGIARTAVGGRLARFLHPVRRHDRGDGAGSRHVATRQRGRLWLLVGMVGSNHPARLLWGMSTALAAAVATTGFVLLTSTVWIISDQMPAWLLVLCGLVAVAAMTGWIIGYHGLWERTRRGRDREQVVLFNGATVATIGVGVLCLFGCVLVANLVAALAFLSHGILRSYLGHPLGVEDFLDLAFLSATVSVLAGAFGSGLEDERSVRRAAYGFREQQRQEREAREQERQERETEERTAAEGEQASASSS